MEQETVEQYDFELSSSSNSPNRGYELARGNYSPSQMYNPMSIRYG